MRHLSVWIVLIHAFCLAQMPDQNSGGHGKLPDRIPELMNQSGVPGLSIALIEDGKIAWIGSFGVKNVTTGDKVDDRTVFQAASLSKPVFGYAVLKLVDQGKLDLETRPYPNTCRGTWRMTAA